MTFDKRSSLARKQAGLPPLPDDMKPDLRPPHRHVPQRVQEILTLARERSEIVQDVCGRWVYWSRYVGVYTAADLAVIVDELDRLNAERERDWQL